MRAGIAYIRGLGQLIAQKRHVKGAQRFDIKTPATITARVVAVFAAAYMALLTLLVPLTFMAFKAVRLACCDDPVQFDLLADSRWIFAQNIGYRFERAALSKLLFNVGSFR